MAEEKQNFANHRSFDKLFIGTALVVFLCIVASVISFVVNISSLSGLQILGALSQVVLPVAVLLIMIRARQYSTTVQDRIVRLEMRLRLEKLGLGDQAEKLSRSQFIGLRFASDGEMPGLVEKVISENITKSDDIKKLVKDWQPDFLRV